MTRARHVKHRSGRAQARGVEVSTVRARRDWPVLLAILTVGFLLRASYLHEISGEPDFSYPLADAAFHDYWARGLVTGDWTPPEGDPDPTLGSTPYLRPPGYPWFLGLLYLVTGSSYVGARVIQMGLGLASCVLGFFLGRSLFGRGVGFVLGAFMSVYWVFIYFEGELQAPVLLVFMTLLLMHVLRLWADKPTRRRAVASGLLIGVIALVRPNVLLFVPAVLGWGWWIAWRRRERRRFPILASGCLLGLVLAIAPVTVRNYLVASDFVLISSNGAINLYIGNNERSDGFSVRLPELQELTGRSGWSWFSYGRLVRGIERQVGRPMKYSDVSSHFVGKALDFIRAHPLTALGLVGKRAALFWGPMEISNNKAIHYEREQSRTLRYMPGFPLVMSLSLVGISLLVVDSRARQKVTPGDTVGRSPAGGRAGDGENRQAPILPDRRLTAPPGQVSPKSVEVSVLFLLFIASYFCSFLPFLVAARFRVPIVPLLLLFGAYGLSRVGQFACARQWRRMACWTIVGIGLYLLANQQIVPYEPDRAWWHTDRGVAYARGSELDQAIREFRAALGVKPGYPDAHLHMAGALAKQGKIDEAIQHYRSTLRSRPLNAAARHRLAALLAERDRSDEAVQEYERILEIDPKSAEAHYDLARAHSRRGASTEAIDAYREALSINPGYVAAHINLGVVLVGLGRTDEGIAEYRTALGLDPRSLDARYNLARALGIRGASAEAIAEYRAVLRLRADHVESRVNLGVLLQQNGDIEAAIDEFRRALQIDPNKFEVHYNLAGALAAQGKTDRAIQELQAALRIIPDQPAALRALRALQAQERDSPGS